MTVLFLTHRLPYAPNRGDRIRAHYILRALSDVASVHLASLLRTPGEARHVPDVAPLVSSITLGRIPWAANVLRVPGALVRGRTLTHALLDSPTLRAGLHDLVARHRPDVVLAFCSSMAPYAMELADAGIPFVLDLVDVDSLKWQAFAERSRGWRSAVYRREARLLRAFELAAIRRATTTVVVNEREKQALGAAGERVIAVPHGIDVEFLAPPTAPAATKQVVLAGVMNYLPNVDAAEWFATAVWPLVRRRLPDATLVIAGAAPIRRVRRLADRGAGIAVTGTVPDIRPVLWHSALAVAPIRIARGVQTKVLEAVGAGLPVVTTSQVAHGLPPAIVATCVVADQADAFAEGVIELLRLDPVARRRRAAAANLDAFRFDRMLHPLIEALESACTRPERLTGAA